MPLVIFLDFSPNERSKNLYKLLCGLSGLTERWCRRSVLKDCFRKGWDLDAEFCNRHSVDKTFKQVKIETEVRVW